MKEQIISSIFILLFSILIVFGFYLLFRASGWVTTDECERYKTGDMCDFCKLNQLEGSDA